MNFRQVRWTALLAFAGICAGCQKKSTPAEVKEAWEPFKANDPAKVPMNLNYRFFELPASGRSTKIPWAESYWPRSNDSFNYRWQPGELSPLEKYDKAFNGWVPPADFNQYKPLTKGECREWDRNREQNLKYYDLIGPAAKARSNDEKGNYAARQLMKRSPTTSACSAIDSTIEGWEGSCHTWTGAALLEEEPIRPVTIHGVRFDLSDIRALLMATYDVADSIILGERCSQNPGTGARPDDAWCRDVNPGSFHLIVANYIGVHKLPIGEDRVMGKQVWNQPVHSYESQSEEVSREQALALLPRNAGPNPFASNAVKFMKVKTTLSYVFEPRNLPSRETTVDRVLDSYTETDTYNYILELDSDGKIVGGEWMTGSEHPDFLWLGIAQGQRTNTNISRWEIKKIQEISRSPEGSEPTFFENLAAVPIRAWWEGPYSSNIVVPNDVPACKAKFHVDIAHPWTQALDVWIEKDGHEVFRMERLPQDRRSVDLVRTFDMDLSGLGNLKGNWTLKVKPTDSRSESGTILSFGIVVPAGQTLPCGEATPTPAPTPTPTPTPIATPTPSDTPTPSATPTPPATPVDTPVPTPTAPATPEPTPVPPTRTPLPTPAATAEPMATPPPQGGEEVEPTKPFEVFVYGRQKRFFFQR